MGETHVMNVTLRLSQLHIIREDWYDYYILRYVFPFQFLLGFSGNVLNLVVLLSRGMRTKTNIVLALMAFADITFLLVMLPRSLAAFHAFHPGSVSYNFMQRSKNVRLGLLNWLSAISIWLVLVVSIERVMVIRFPLQARFYWKTKRLVATAISIFLITFILTFHTYIANDVTKYVVNNGTATYWQHESILTRKNGTYKFGTSTAMATYVKASFLIQAFCVVFIPLLVLLLLNGLLVYFLTQQHRSMSKGMQSGDKMSNPDTARATERRVTVMVVIIVASFTLTNGPSAVMNLHQLATDPCCSPTFFNMLSIANNLVVTGKVLNFFLYCTSSANFRSRLVGIVCKKDGMLSRWVRQATTHFHTLQTSTTPFSRSRAGSNNLVLDENRGAIRLDDLKGPNRRRFSDDNVKAKLRETARLVKQPGRSKSLANQKIDKDIIGKFDNF